MNRFESIQRSINMPVICVLMIVLFGWVMAPLAPVMTGGGCRMLCCKTQNHYDDDSEACYTVRRTKFNNRYETGSFNANIQSKCPVNCTAPSSFGDVHKRIVNRTPQLTLYDETQSERFEFEATAVRLTLLFSTSPSRAPPLS